MTECWASSLGDCGEEASRAHLVSAALWESTAIRVEGFPWLKGQVKMVGINSLTSQILCKDHNNALSPTDSAAARAFHVFRYASKLGIGRGKIPARQWLDVGYQVSGTLLERWFFKTAINLACMNRPGLRWHSNGAPLNEPDPQIVRMAFGRERIVKPFGLHVVASTGECVPSRDEIAFAPLIYGDSVVIGVLFEFKGFRFLLNMQNQPLPETLALSHNQMERWAAGEVNYHMERFQWFIGAELSHYFEFVW